MPKITRHGGASNMYEIESAFIGNEGEEESPPGEVTYPPGQETKPPGKEESSVGDSLSKSSKPTPTIEEILGIDHP